MTSYKSSIELLDKIELLELQNEANTKSIEILESNLASSNRRINMLTEIVRELTNIVKKNTRTNNDFIGKYL